MDVPASPILERVGNTPIVDLSVLAPRSEVRVLGKLESTNPGGSVKDRAAAAIIAAAWPQLREGAVLVDATSGNTGVAYAVLGASLGIRVRLFVPSNASPSRLMLLRTLGVDLRLTDPLEGTDGAQEAAEAHASKHDDALLVDQYANEANPKAHEVGTGPELWAQTDGAITHFVAGIGTSGTITGCGRFFKGKDAGIQVFGVEPAEPLHGLEGLKHLATAHVPPILDRSVIDTHVHVPTMDAWRRARDVARATGCLVGPSSGAAVAAALDLASELDAGCIAVVLPDGAERYTGTPFGAFMAGDAQ